MDVVEWAQDEGYFSDPRPMQLVKVNPSVLEELAGSSDKNRVMGANFNLESDFGIKKTLIVLPNKSSTRTKLHELEHYALGHSGSPSSPRDEIEKELLVEIRSLAKMGQSPSPEHLAGMTIGTVNDWGITKMEAFSILKQSASKIGFKRPREFWSKVWSRLKDWY